MGRVMALFYDRMLAATEEAGLRDLRRELLAAARGEFLEIGAGTGVNLALYPDGVDRVVATEPDRHMAARLRRKLDDARVPVEVVEAGAQDLPFPDASFDTAVVTLVLCTVPDQRAALAEIGRVLRPGGRLLFIEHVRSPERRLARWQDRLLPLWKRVAGGCHPNRDTLGILRQSPLTVTEVREGTLPKAAPIVKPMISGIAERPAIPASATATAASRAD